MAPQGHQTSEPTASVTERLMRGLIGPLAAAGLMGLIAWKAYGVPWVGGLLAFALVLVAAVTFYLVQAVLMSPLEERVKARREAVENRRAAVENTRVEVTTACSITASAYSALPALLRDARQWRLDAERHLDNGVAPRFWESVEHAYEALGAYEARISEITRGAKSYAPAYQRLRELVGDDAALPSFPLSPQEIAEAETAKDEVASLDDLVYEAQRDPYFGQVFEQRRTTSATIEGFQSLTAAVASMHHDLSAQVAQLSQAVHDIGDQISSSVLAVGDHVVGAVQGASAANVAAIDQANRRSIATQAVLAGMSAADLSDALASDTRSVSHSRTQVVSAAAALHQITS